MSRGSSQAQGAQGQRPEQASCEIVTCDREDSEAFLRAITSPHCPRVIVDFTVMCPAHVEAVLEAHSKRSLDHYIFISTNMVYPGGIEDMDVTGLTQPITEDAADLAGAAVAPDTYGGQKLKCEALLQQAARDTGFPSTTFRPPAVIGPGCDNRHEKLQRLVAGLPPLPVRDSKRPLTRNPGAFRVAYCGDVAEVVAAAVSRGRLVHGETFNVACAESISIEDYAAAIATTLGRASPEVPNDAVLRNYERQGELDVTKAQRLLGFQPTPIADWMPEVVLWHQRLMAGSAAL